MARLARLGPTQRRLWALGSLPTAARLTIGLDVGDRIGRGTVPTARVSPEEVFGPPVRRRRRWLLESWGLRVIVADARCRASLP
jgi:hypothetical protein